MHGRLFRRSCSALALAVVCTLSPAAGGVSAAPAVPRTGDLPVWSPDGTQFAYVAPSLLPLPSSQNAPDSDFEVLLRSGVDGHPRLVARIDRSERAAELRWAGREQLIVSDGPGGSLWRIDLATGRLVGLADRAPLSLASDDTFAVSADGSRVAYTADSPFGSENLTSEGRIPDVFAIGVVSTSGGVARLLTQPEHASDAYPSFSPDDSRIVFARTMLRHGLPVGFGPPSLMVQSVNGGGQALERQWRPTRVVAQRALDRIPAPRPGRVDRPARARGRSTCSIRLTESGACSYRRASTSHSLCPGRPTPPT